MNARLTLALKGVEHPDLITTREAAALFQVDPATVSGWARRGLLPATRTLGGQWRFRREDVISLTEFR